MKPNGFVFWEVPNAECPANGAMRRKIDVPHTYYFRKSYFENVFSKILINEAFHQTHDFGIFQDWAKYQNSEGAVIRVLGKF